LENIIQNPTEDKFRKIRLSNRVYQEKVASLEGTQDFLLAAGFKVMKLPFQDGEEDFWVFSEENLDSNETLQVSVFFSFLKTLRSQHLNMASFTKRHIYFFLFFFYGALARFRAMASPTFFLYSPLSRIYLRSVNFTKLLTQICPVSLSFRFCMMH
jgi:uncharacterized protein with PQ loop repeat